MRDQVSTATGPPPPSAIASRTSAAHIRGPRHRVDRRAVLWWTLRMLVGAGVTLGALGLTYWLWEASRPWVGPVALVAAAGFLVTTAVMPAWRYHVHRWECTEHAVYELKGWLVREWRIIPVSRIQSVDMVRGPLQLMLGLGTLRVVTASPEGRIKIVGLDADVVAKEAAVLTELTQTSAGDAT
ncbi:PH domain-containing protein [Streptomyces sp. NPDC004111]|uniref:PH domain-containing protein n=1 Tax=Streptomyces sp. NPDC004111 TaxID=3364690 RepID=UPI0036BB5EAD